jgi:uncharacterized protein involved in response to NO
MKAGNDLARQEPFRIFFPLGLTAAVLAVMLWPAFYAGLLPYYPLHAHARVVILGFVGAFVIGFAGTAFPRLAGVEGLRKLEMPLLLALWTASCAAYLMTRIAWGDAFSLALWLLLVLLAAWRLPRRKDTPPPGFVLVALGVMALLTGLVLLLLDYLLAGERTALLRLCAREWLYLGFPSMVFFGVAPYFFPKVMGCVNRHEFPESRKIPKGWLPRAAAALLTGLTVLAGGYLRARGHALGGWLIAVAFFAYTLSEIPILPATGHWGSVSTGLCLGLLLYLWGLFLMAVGGTWNLPFFHVGMIGGLCLCMMMVSFRVVHGHSGKAGLSMGWLPASLALLILLVTAAALRGSADQVFMTRELLLLLAAITFVCAMAIWILSAGPRLFEVENDQAPPANP